jgi:hypothetical protein
MMLTDQIAADRPSTSGSHQPWPDIADAVTDADLYARTLIKQRPVVAVMAAVAFGYLVARLIARGVR